MISQKVKDLVDGIVLVYASYGFTDWDEAIHDSIESAGEEGTTYTEAEIAEAEKLAMTIARSLKQHYDTVSKEVLK